MKTFIAFLLLFCIKLNAQDIFLKEVDKPVAGAKYFWAYSVRRIGTAHDSLYNYTIWVSVVKRDIGSSNSHKTVKISNPYISCIVKNPEGGIKKIRCFPNEVHFIGNFTIHTNQKVPVTIVAIYNKRNYNMDLVLNEGAYPGENNIEE